MSRRPSHKKRREKKRSPYAAKKSGSCDFMMIKSGSRIVLRRGFASGNYYADWRRREARQDHRQEDCMPPSEGDSALYAAEAQDAIDRQYAG